MIFDFEFKGDGYFRIIEYEKAIRLIQEFEFNNKINILLSSNVVRN